MHTKLSFIPTIEISNFGILDSKENPKPILQIPQMDATVEIIPLIKNFQIEIQKIDILLISMDLSNLTLKTPQKDTPQANPKQQITEKTNSYSGLDKLWVKNININRVLCRFTNKEKKDAVELNNVILKDLSNLKFQLVYHNKKFDVDGSFGSLIKLISETKELIDLAGKPYTQHCWSQVDDFYEKYDHPIWKKYRENQLGGHGGMDYLVLSAFVEAVQKRVPTPIDVYDVAAWMSVTALSEQSVALGGQVLPFPDFTNGKWIAREAETPSKWGLNEVVEELWN
jgi:hypothetical protein